MTEKDYLVISFDKKGNAIEISENLTYDEAARLLYACAKLSTYARLYRDRGWFKETRNRDGTKFLRDNWFPRMKNYPETLNYEKIFGDE